MIKCLHICNDFLGSRVHRNLYTALSEKNLDQIVYYPQGSGTPDPSAPPPPFDVLAGEFKTSPLDRINQVRKAEKSYNSIRSNIDLNSVDIVHASTLVSNGLIAYKIFKEYNIPYIIAVRGTDINLFLRFRPDLYRLILKILQNASKIVFISQAHQRHFYKKRFIKKFTGYKELADKTKVIHNGIQDFWLINQRPLNKKNSNPCKLLYIGNFRPNKNTYRLAKAVIDIHENINNSISISFVGKGGSEEKKIRYLAKKYSFINFLGPQYNKEELFKIIRDHHIFAMVSHSETFGLVYLEALSQGLPIVYTSGQGIDGTFSFEVGRSAIPKKVSSIKESIMHCIAEYSNFHLEKIDFNVFKWSTVSANYMDLYFEVLSKNKLPISEESSV
ncbi:glycosyltransferase family 4 protein [Robertkochia marina]|nr:glycosyltransferase family 4 protein [Robertkochia marina]